MPQRLYDAVSNWFNGINTSASADQLPDGFSPRGRNTALKLLGEGSARIGKRRGALTLNATAITGSPAVAGFQFKKQNGNKYTLLVGDNGRLDKLNSDGTTTVINATAFTSGAHYPRFSVANDLCFIFNDVDQKKFDGTSVFGVGIVRPAAPSASAGAGGAAGMLGAYDFALTYYNANTGHESSLSDFTPVTVGAGQKVTVSWSAPVDLQVTHVRVYIRKQTLGAPAFRVIASALPAADAVTGGYAPATLATVVDIADTTINAFILLAPTTTENDPPLAGTQFPTWHGNRMFVADSGNIYYSNIANNTPYPEAFNPNNSEPVNPDDGDTIVGLYSMWGRLFIFKRFSVWKLDGSDPNSWTVSLVSADHGLASQASICSAEGVLFWWDSVNGPVAFDGDGLPVNIGQQFLSSTIAVDEVNQLQLSRVCSEVDEDTQTVLWAYPEFNATRNTRIVPFNYRAKRFNAEYWNPFDVYSMFSVETSDHLKATYFGNYGGQVFQFGAASNDGVPAGSTTHGSVTAATGTTLSSSGAAFSTTGAGLKERYVYAISQDRFTVQRRRITANTATQVTVTPAWDTTPNTTYTYAIGAIALEVDTPWLASGDIFLKKRYEFLLTELTSSDIGATVDIDLFRNMDDSDPVKTITLSLAGSGGVYDAETSTYDHTTYSSSAMTISKSRMAFTGKAWKARIRNCMPDQDVVVYKISGMSKPLGILN